MLGNCEKCTGNLCVSGRQVNCERCGHIVEGHPLTASWNFPPAPPPAPVVEQHQVASSIPARVLTLERQVAELMARDEVPMAETIVGAGGSPPDPCTIANAPQKAKKR